MEQTLPENLQLGQLVANALSEIERLGYSRRSRNRYRAIWEHLIEFSRCRAVLKGRTGRALFSGVSGQLVQTTLY